MATEKEFVDYVCEQINGVGSVMYKKMFGEYMVYVNMKPILLVCDNTVFVKMFDEVKDLMKDSERGYPYKNAKECYILDIDDRDLAFEVVNILEGIVPIPKPRKKKATV